jgi:hypothetical protein
MDYDVGTGAVMSNLNRNAALRVGVEKWTFDDEGSCTVTLKFAGSCSDGEKVLVLGNPVTKTVTFAQSEQSGTGSTRSSSFGDPRQQKPL